MQQRTELSFKAFSMRCSYMKYGIQTKLYKLFIYLFVVPTKALLPLLLFD